MKIPNNLSHKIDQFSKITRDINKYLSKTSDILKETPLETLNHFNNYLIPKERYESLLKFYKTFLDSHEQLINLTQSLQNLKSKSTTNLNNELEIISIHKNLNFIVNDLKKYGEIKIVQKLIVETQLLIPSAVESVKNGFFKHFEIKYPDLNDYTKSFKYEDFNNKDNYTLITNLRTIGSFLLKNYDKSEFGLEYIKIIILKFNLETLKNDKNKLLNFLETLTEKINFVEEINERILERKISDIVTKGILDQIINKTKKYIFETILMIDKEGEAFNILYLLDMLKVIYKNNFKDKNNFKNKNNFNDKNEISDKRNFKDTNVFENFIELKIDIERVIINLLNIFFISEDEINPTLYVQSNLKIAGEIAKKIWDEEEISESVKNIYNELNFKNQLNFKDKVTLKIQNEDNFRCKWKKDFIRKILIKPIHRVIKFSERLPEIEKSLYLLNNYLNVQNFISEINEESVRDLVNKHKMGFFNEIKKSINNTGINITKKVNKRILKLSKYCVCEDYRDFFVDEIIKIVLDFMKEREYDGGEKKFKKEAEKIFKSVNK
ncbi:hypothetical protein DMUE_3555 [Dictyocoela muelleri]|nr:hypothetical protein DMUE_3555 [Dictyocoela muelleri]